MTFDASKCKECGGKCCKGEKGYIWIREDEILLLAKFLGVSKAQLIEGCIAKTTMGYSIKDIIWKNERVCFFFDHTNNNCSIYEVRPQSCRDFPFWKGVSKEYLEKECIGVSF